MPTRQRMLHEYRFDDAASINCHILLAVVRVGSVHGLIGRGNTSGAQREHLWRITDRGTKTLSAVY